MVPSRTNLPHPPSGEPLGPEAEASRVSGPHADCRTCALRSGCITYGWRSPAGLWFENAVILKPPAGCRGYVGRGDDIRAHFSAPTRDREH